MFFVNTVFVTPSRFRPESKLGEEKYLHNHTTVLARVIESNVALKYMISQTFGEKDKEMDGHKWTGSKGIMATNCGELKKTRFYGEALKRMKGKSDFINKWLDLQDGINCYIDAKKSSRAADR